MDAGGGGGWQRSRPLLEALPCFACVRVRSRAAQAPEKLQAFVATHVAKGSADGRNGGAHVSYLDR